MSIDSNLLSILAIAISSIIGIPTFIISFIELISLKKLRINQTWNYIYSFFSNYEILSPWNSNKSKEERWEEYIMDLVSQGLIWFTSKEVIDEFINPYNFKTSIFKIKNELEKQTTQNIWKIHKRWKLLDKKGRIVIQQLLDFGFVTICSIFHYLSAYPIDIKTNFGVEIKKTSITFIPELDNLKLWGYKNFGSTSNIDKKINLNELKKNEKKEEKNRKKTLKNNDYIFNIIFSVDDDSIIKRHFLTFSIHFKNKKISYIETVYDHDIFFKSEDDYSDIFINCINCIKNMFNINQIFPLLNEKWKNKNSIYGLEDNFYKIRQKVMKL